MDRRGFLTGVAALMGSACAAKQPKLTLHDKGTAVTYIRQVQNYIDILVVEDGGLNLDTPASNVLVELEAANGWSTSAYTDDKGYALLTTVPGIHRLLVNYKYMVDVHCDEEHRRALTIRLGGN